MAKCPVCEKGVLRKKQVEYASAGVKVGSFPAEVCPKCGEEIFDEKTAEKIQSREKELGIFGLGRETEIKKIGASYGLIIPKPLAVYLNIREHLKVLLLPEGKNKLVVEMGKA